MRIGFRCDGGRVWGLSFGHVYRCLALARDVAARSDVEVRFIMKAFPEGIALVRDGGFDVEPVDPAMPGEDEIDMLCTSRDDVLVFDGPDLAGKDIGRLARHGKRTIALDEAGRSRIEADIVVNGSVVHEFHAYPPGRPSTRYCLGPDYAVLAHEFEAVPRHATGQRAERVLISLGGADMANLTPRVVEALAALGVPVEVDLVLGPAVAIDDGDLAARDSGGPRIRLYRGVPSLHPFMASCDFAIAAAGRTAYELAATGTPALLVPSQEIEARVAEALQARGAALTTGPADEPDWTARFRDAFARLHRDGEMRRRMAEAGPRIVDGKGRRRVAAMIVNGA